VLARPPLPVADEVGHLPSSRTGTALFFQRTNRRYEWAAAVPSSNKGFEELGEVLGDGWWLLP